jgi:hypothetical protein
MTRIVLAALIAFTITFFGTARAVIIEVGDLNFIDDAGNPSDGLGFLDMSFSVGLTQADALTNAQLTYADARIATPDEFDDLFLAAGVTYSGALTASDGFEVGLGEFITPGLIPEPSRSSMRLEPRPVQPACSGGRTRTVPFRQPQRVTRSHCSQRHLACSHKLVRPHQMRLSAGCS